MALGIFSKANLGLMILRGNPNCYSHPCLKEYGSNLVLTLEIFCSSLLPIFLPQAKYGFSV